MVKTNEAPAVFLASETVREQSGYRFKKASVQDTQQAKSATTLHLALIPLGF